MEAKKFELSPSVGYHSHQKIEFLQLSPDRRPHFGKYNIIAFRQNLPKILPAACIFSYTILTYLKKLDEAKSHRISPRNIPQVSPF